MYVCTYAYHKHKYIATYITSYYINGIRIPLNVYLFILQSNKNLLL